MATSEDTPSAAMLDAVRKFATELAELRQQEQQERIDTKQQVEEQLTALRHDVYGSILLLDQRQADTAKEVAHLRDQYVDEQHWRLNITKVVEQISASVAQVNARVEQNDLKRYYGQWRNTAILATLLIILIWLLIARVL